MSEPKSSVAMFSNSFTFLNFPVDKEHQCSHCIHKYVFLWTKRKDHQINCLRKRTKESGNFLRFCCPLEKHLTWVIKTYGGVKYLNVIL